MGEREIRFGLLLNAQEREALARLAESAGGLSLGAMIRHMVRTEARQQGLWPAAQYQAPKGEDQTITGGRDDTQQASSRR